MVSRVLLEGQQNNDPIIIVVFTNLCPLRKENIKFFATNENTLFVISFLINH